VYRKRRAKAALRPHLPLPHRSASLQSSRAERGREREEGRGGGGERQREKERQRAAADQLVVSLGLDTKAGIAQ